MTSTNDQLIFTGVDFGTTSSAIGYVIIAGRTGLITNPKPVEFLKMSKVPTAVYYRENGEVPYVGKEALDDAARNPDNFFSEFKLHLKDPDTPIRHLADGQSPTARELAEHVLKYLINIANTSGISLEKTVICHPVGSTWESTLTQIVHKLGITNAHTMSEPLAALYYADHLYKIFDDRKQLTLLIDFGGGTCDLFLLEVNTSFLSRFWVNYGERTKAQEQLEYKDLNGKKRSYGGKDIDSLLTDLIIERWEYENKTESDEFFKIRNFNYIWRLRKVAKEAKETLSSYITSGSPKQSYPIHVDKLPGNSEISFELTIQEFQELVKTDLETKLKTFLQGEEGFFQRYKVDGNNVDYVFFVGGSSRLPWLKEIVGGICSKASQRGQIHVLREPELSVAFGAALYNYYFQMKELPVSPALEETLQLGVEGAVYELARKNTSLPFVPTQFRSTHYIKLRQVSDRVPMQLYVGDGDRVSDCRPLGEERVVQFEEKLRAGTMLALKVAIDQIGHLEITLYPYGRPKMAQSVIFESLNVV